MRNPRRAEHVRQLCFLFTSLTLSLAFGVITQGQVGITDVNPDRSDIAATQSNAASGGRVNGLAGVPGDNQTFYAASEWGGLYKSADGGRTWARLNNHSPTVTWDVEVSPADAKRVFATSFYDGRVKSLAGINVSADGGSTWTHPPTAVPPAGLCLEAARRDEPSAFGISVDPDDPRNVYIGTNCGLAISNDSGSTWRFVDPTPGDRADDVWDVVVHHGGIVDTCGDDGHRRSTDGGVTWSTASGTALPSGMCSIAASPDEPYVLFSVVSGSIFESDDGGANWATQFANPAPVGRIPFVATNARSAGDTVVDPQCLQGCLSDRNECLEGVGSPAARRHCFQTFNACQAGCPRVSQEKTFDLWFGDMRLFRAGCTTPRAPAPGGAARCPASDQWVNSTGGAHNDAGDIVFDTQATGVRCPVLFSSDGGVYFNSSAPGPECQTPAWAQPNVTPHGLWLFGMAGADRGGAASEDLYLTNQDNGTFATMDAGAGKPTWFNRDCCDAFDVSAETTRVLYTECCFFQARAIQLFLRDPGMTGGGEINNYPPGLLPGFGNPDILDTFGPAQYVLITTSGVFITTDVTANPIVWTQLGAATGPPNACAVWAAGVSTNPTFYVQAGGCTGDGADTLWRYTGTAPGGSWRVLSPPPGSRGFGIFTVDRNDPNRLFASHFSSAPAGPQMIRSTNGGSSWAVDTALNNLMTGGGTFRFQNQRGPTAFTAFNGYAQPTLVAYDPIDPNILLAGGADSGIFLSTDGGAKWSTVTNNIGEPSNPHLPRPRFAYFDHERGALNIYVGTQGRGVWRMTYLDPASECLRNCEADRNACMAEVGRPGGPTAAQCAQQFAACRARCLNPPQTLLTIRKVLIPAGDTGLFNLLIDGATRATNVGNGGTTGPMVVSAGAHTVSEAAGNGHSLSDYTATIGGDCNPDGSITLASGDTKTCILTNTRKPPPPRLTVNKILSPAGDPGRFNLSVDGNIRAANVGHGGSTGPLVLSAGAHSVGETASGNTNLSNYNVVIGGDCATDGSITLSPGDNKVCTIMNTEKRVSCLAECLADRDDCLSRVGQPGGPTAAQCVQQYNACRRRCTSR